MAGTRSFLAPLRAMRPRALTLSVALNLFLAGAAAGLLLGEGAAPEREPAVEYSFAEFVRDLPDDTRQRIAAALDDRRGDVARRIEALNSARARVVTALGAEPHDPDKVRRALVSLRESTRDVQAVMHAVVGEIARGLSPPEREQLALGMLATVRRSSDGAALLYEVPLL